MKIILVCATGMSTSMLVERMEAFTQEEDVIIACGRNEIHKHLATADCVLVAPQIRYLFDTLYKQCKDEFVAAELIDLQSYGQLDGKQIIEQAKNASAKTFSLKER